MTLECVTARRMYIGYVTAIDCLLLTLFVLALSRLRHQIEWPEGARYFLDICLFYTLILGISAYGQWVGYSQTYKRFCFVRDRSLQQTQSLRLVRHFFVFRRVIMLAFVEKAARVRAGKHPTTYLAFFRNPKTAEQVAQLIADFTGADFARSSAVSK